MDSSESAIWHHWVAPVEEIWTFASVICPLHTFFSAFPISTPACLFQPSLGVVHLCVISSLDRFLCCSVHYARPNLLAPVLSYRLSWQTLNPDLPSGVFFLNYTWCSASSCTFCLHVQEKPWPSIPWVHLHVVISTSSLVPLVRAWELMVAHTGSRMSLCVSYSLSASLYVLVKLVWFYLHSLFPSLTTLLLSSLLCQSYPSLSGETTTVPPLPVLALFILPGILHCF